MKNNAANHSRDSQTKKHVVDPEQYHVDYETGFMLNDSLESLPQYFKAWNDMAANLPQLVKEKKVRETVDKMPLLDHNKLVGHRQWRLAHLQLCFVTAGYVWEDGDKGVPKILPECLAVPFYRISEKLGIKPVLGHVDLALANYAVIDKDQPYDFDNLKCLYHLPGEEQGDWFCMVTFMLEFSFAKGIKPIVRILDLLESIHNNTEGQTLEEKEAEIVRCLEDVAKVIRAMQTALSRMHDHLEAKVFFNVLRPFLGGWGGEGNPLPDGLIYQGISDKPIIMPGGSAAQSSTLQVVDALLGVEHTADKKEFLVHMRSFMPPKHKSFIEAIEQVKFTLRSYVQSCNNQALTKAYNTCLSALVELRSYHIQIVMKYVVMASKTTNEGNYESLDTKGTGGTSLIPFLKVIREDTDKKKVPTSPAPQPSLPCLVKNNKYNLIFGAVAAVAVGFTVSYFLPK